MKKQTAVEWLIESLEKLEYNLEKGIISLDDYIINVMWIKDQSKALEKEQMRLIYEGMLQNVGTSVKQSDLPTFEQYYDETYGN
jgi:hypothetical protein